jgi:phosphoribosylformylglycinamidine synthase
MYTSSPKILILSGYGLNCEQETAAAFELEGGKSDIVHINDLIADKKKLSRYQILAIPGGFSYGDDTGSGKAYANKLKNHLQNQLLEFVSKDKLVIGICNGFQILANTGLLPGALTFNDNNRYTDRWVDCSVPNLLGKQNQPINRRATFSPWLSGITKLSLPIAHGEGKYYATDEIIGQLKKDSAIAAKYVKGEVCDYQNLSPNPNGSLLDIAAITGYNGRVLGIMPHPERAMFFTQLPNWPLLKEKLIRAGKTLPKYGPGLEIFKNSIKYFI